ncbi:pantoate--beta-alanine ligase [Mesobacillus persicus]|uniref:Pantothenate synthetase n=1 Tax=Mesobacillus persicus TaxID=930146 RepID=A0A1H8BMC0_9BACI|nr:pantoate--beta-alanine ligase [Mesobacillus persicus]SEM84051.1 pantoate--beta-alanine ligase [Mesobacillus persicus]
MNVIHSIEEMQKKILRLKSSGNKIGFVPTMGYLHEGHKALMKQARKENDVLVLSIFVNPLQFGPGEDLEAYPRDFEHDRMVAKEEGADFIFYPTVQEMYPKHSSVKVSVEDRTDVLCGKSRPGHFDGVATVLTKLFHLIMPDRVYLGLKDAQQVAVVDGLIKDFNFPIELVPVPTVRELDGLAKSSRNVNLLSIERDQAKELYQSLLYAKEEIEQGERDPEKVIDMVKAFIEMRCDAKIDYVEIYSYPELKPLNIIAGKVILALAVKFSKARLIDNLILEIV